MSKKCNCPNCENELEMGCLEPAFCTPCNVTVVKCDSCGQEYSEKLEACPKCKEPNPKRK